MNMQEVFEAEIESHDVAEATKKELMIERAKLDEVIEFLDLKMRNSRNLLDQFSDADKPMVIESDKPIATKNT